jgi:hypothetical protein
MESNKKSYYAIIPANVRYDESLPPNAKLLYGEITALCNAEGFCWASNKYFAELYGVSTISISKWINVLAKSGYISCEILYKEGTKQIDKRYITILYDPIKEKFNTPIKEKLKDNNTYLNNKLNNTNEYRGKSDKPTRTRFKPPTKEEVQAYCFERNNQVDAERFIDYYTANGWCVGKNKMKDWKAAVRTWEKNGYANAKTPKRSVGEEAYEFYEIGKQMQEEGEPF